jgi:hypothetical protein
MSDIGVAMHARKHFTARFGRQDLMHKVRMAMQAGLLSHAMISRFNSNGFVEILERKRQRMEKTVVGLGIPLSNKIMRQMAVIADRDVLVAGLLPRIEVALHDMAIRAALRIAAEVTCALPVPKCERSEPGGDSEHAG